ncbi:MAG: hypothetical protein E7617_06800 [Ruminococcaceae bacterium]|nr:hypothetical protein [Oscillospiraceae bacterium]
MISPEIEVGSIERVLLEQGSFASVTNGVSMRPLFKTHRDAVILSRPTEPPKRFDVVLYRVRDKYVLHRIIKVDEENSRYIIRGDNTFTLEYVPMDKILAVLTSFNRKGKHHSVTDRGYRIYARVWNFIYPLRWLIRLPRVCLSRVKHALFAGSKH